MTNCNCWLGPVPFRGPVFGNHGSGGPGSALIVFWEGGGLDSGWSCEDVAERSASSPGGPHCLWGAIRCIPVLNGFISVPVCQKTPRTLPNLAADSICWHCCPRLEFYILGLNRITVSFLNKTVCINDRKITTKLSCRFYVIRYVTERMLPWTGPPSLATPNPELAASRLPESWGTPPEIPPSRANSRRARPALKTQQTGQVSHSWTTKAQFT